MSDPVYSTPMGDPTRLRELVKVVESGAAPTWVYTPDSGADAPAYGQGGLFPSFIKAGTDGSIAVRFTGFQNATIAFISDKTKRWDGATPWRIDTYQAGHAYKPVLYGNYLTDGPNVNAEGGDIVQMRRTGTTVYAEVSKDNGATWINIYTWPNVDPDMDLYGEVGVFYWMSRAEGVWAKGLDSQVNPVAPTPPVLASAIASNVAGMGRVVLNFNEPIDKSKIPDKSAFSVSGHTVAAATNMASLANAIALDVTGLIALGEVVTVTYVAPATNSIIDLDGTPGNSFGPVVAINNVPRPLGVRRRLGYVPPGIAEGGVAPNWTYANTDGNYTTWANTAQALNRMPAGRDGSFELVIGNYANGSFIGLTASSQVNTLPEYSLNIYQFGYPYTLSAGSDAAAVAVLAAPGDICRMRRLGNRIYAEVSKDNGDSYTVVGTWSNTPQVDLYGEVSLAFNTNISAVYSTGFVAATAYDVFVDKARDLDLRGKSWTAEQVSYLNTSVATLAPDGSGGLYKQSNAATLGLAWTQRNEDAGSAVFFTHDGGSYAAIPQLVVASNLLETYTDGIRCSFTDGGFLLEEITNGAVGAMVSNTLALVAGEKYCLEIGQADTVSDKDFVLRISTVVAGERGLLVAYALLNARNAHPGKNAGLLSSAVDSAFDTVTRIETLAQTIPVRMVPSKLLIEAASNQVTQGFSQRLTVRTDQSLAAFESVEVNITDNAGGQFDVANFTLSGTNQLQQVNWRPSNVIGARTLTAQQVTGLDVDDGSLHFEVTVPIPASALVYTGEKEVELGKTLKFVLSTNQPLLVGDTEAYTVSLVGTGSVAPMSGTLNNGDLSQELEFTPQTVGVTKIKFTPMGSPVLPALEVQVTVKPRSPTFVKGINVYEVGIGHQFATAKQASAYIADKKLVDTQAKVYFEYYGDHYFDTDFVAGNTSQEYNITHRPAAGEGYLDKATSGLFHYPDAGTELTFPGSYVTLQRGTVMENFRMKFENNTTLLFSPSNGAGGQAADAYLRNNRILVQRPGTSEVIQSGEYAINCHVQNNLFLLQTPGIYINLRDSAGNVTGNTVIAQGAALGSAVFAMSGNFDYNNTKVQNNVFIDVGAVPFNIDVNRPAPEQVYSNNFTNAAISAAVAPVYTVNTVAPFVADKATDLRPVVNGPLFGKASAYATSTIDGAGQNRGFAPDAGAFQAIPASKLPIVKSTGQTVSGQYVRYTVSVLNEIGSLTARMIPDAVAPDGAQEVGPLPFTVNGGTAYVDILVPKAGLYAPAEFVASNDGGVVKSYSDLPLRVVPLKSSATFDDFVGVADAVVAAGRPTLPFFGTVVDSGVNIVKPLVILSVDNGDFFADGSVTVTASVASPIGVDRVELLRNGVKVDTKTQAPYALTQNLTRADNGTVVYSAKAYDTQGNFTVSENFPIYVRIPAAGATVPTVTSIALVPPSYDGDVAHLEIKFSEAMNTAREFDYSGVWNFGIDAHFTTGLTAFTDATTLRMNYEYVAPVLPGEQAYFSYRKDFLHGWRSAAGVLVESFDGFPVVNNLPEQGSPGAYETFTNVADGANVASVGWDGGAEDTQQVWHASTQLVRAAGAGGAYPATSGQIFASFRRKGHVAPGWGYRDGTGVAAFFKLTAAGQSPYGIAIMCDDGNDGISSFGLVAVRVEVTPDGTLQFRHANNRRPPLAYPPKTGAALDVLQEYALELARVTTQAETTFAMRLWKATNGVRTSLINSASCVVNYKAIFNDAPIAKLYVTDVSAPPALLTRVEEITNAFSAREVVSLLPTGNRSTLTSIRNIVATGSGADMSYAGNGAALSSRPGGIFAMRFLNVAQQSGIFADGGVSAVVGAVVDNIYLGAFITPSAGVFPTEPVAADKMHLAICAPAIGQAYQIYTEGRNRLPTKKMLVAEGDVMRVRTCGLEVFFEVKKNDVWTRIFRIRNAAGGLTDYYTAAQLLLPGNSAVSAIYQ